ncbi:unnamed protein product [Linum trigynum]|uniref:Uncharacterized protein n=1 Tax=Linum trigynum TaxID=586398 RepID=A0AAV2D734_9ROSI
MHLNDEEMFVEDNKRSREMMLADSFMPSPGPQPLLLETSSGHSGGAPTTTLQGEDDPPAKRQLMETEVLPQDDLEPANSEWPHGAE